MADYLTKDKLQRYHAGLTAKIPAKASQLENDSGYITEAALAYDRQEARGCYAGRPLVEVPELAAEVAAYGNVYDFLHNRALMNDFTGIRLGDTFEVEHGVAGTLVYRVAGFNCLRSPDVDVAYNSHVVCVPADFVTFSYGWGDNAYISYADSTLHQWEKELFGPALPDELENVLLYREAVCDTCDSSGNWDVAYPYLGKVWSPSETEVFGSCVFGHPLCTGLCETQFPLFRVLPPTLMTTDSTKTAWLRNHAYRAPQGGEICYVSNGSAGAAYAADTTVCTMPCFAIE